SMRPMHEASSTRALLCRHPTAQHIVCGSIGAEDARRQVQQQQQQEYAAETGDSSGGDIDFGPLKDKLAQLSSTTKNKLAQLKQKYFSNRSGSSHSRTGQYRTVGQSDRLPLADRASSSTDELQEHDFESH